MAKNIKRKLKFNPVGVGHNDSLGHTHSSHFRRLRSLLRKKHGSRCCQPTWGNRRVQFRIMGGCYRDLPCR